MTAHSPIRTSHRNSILIVAFLFLSPQAFTQKAKADSLSRLLALEKQDTNRVRLMWQLAGAMNVYNPDTAMILAQQASYLAKSSGYMEGQSRALGMLANTFIKIGNYPRALEFNLAKLKLEEQRNKPRNLASVLMNIGVVYVLQEEYRKALTYYSKSDSTISKHNIEDLKYFSALNLGDVYNRLDISDSAFTFFSQALRIAKEMEDGDLIGTAMTGLGHSHLKLGNYKLSRENYQLAIAYLTEANDDEILCETMLGLANLYRKLGNTDSAGHYAKESLQIARKDGFISKELEASEFLTKHYKDARNIDSAFAYITYVHTLNDSINSKSKIREMQIMSTNEQFRQLELEEDRKNAREERSQQLQLLLIAIFIPSFFLLTLLLSRVKVHIKAIRALGVLSLLFLFEYLTLLLHPFIAARTGHTPVYEILIFVAIAAVLIPAHHRVEHWLIQRLIHHRHGYVAKPS